ncbi:hypothetical protein EV715DRAFT_268088 [Schizophyllum commune]
MSGHSLGSWSSMAAAQRWNAGERHGIRVVVWPSCPLVVVLLVVLPGAEGARRRSSILGPPTATIRVEEETPTATDVIPREDPRRSPELAIQPPTSTSRFEIRDSDLTHRRPNADATHPRLRQAQYGFANLPPPPQTRLQAFEGRIRLLSGFGLPPSSGPHGGAREIYDARATSSSPSAHPTSPYDLPKPDFKPSYGQFSASAATTFSPRISPSADHSGPHGLAFDGRLRPRAFFPHIPDFKLRATRSSARTTPSAQDGDIQRSNEVLKLQGADPPTLSSNPTTPSQALKRDSAFFSDSGVRRLPPEHRLYSRQAHDDPPDPRRAIDNPRRVLYNPRRVTGGLRSMATERRRWSLGDELTFGPGASGNTSWDQFATIDKLFGGPTTTRTYHEARPQRGWGVGEGGTSRSASARPSAAHRYRDSRRSSTSSHAEFEVEVAGIKRRAMRNRAKSAEFGENAIQGEIMNLPSKRMKRSRGVGHGRQVELNSKASENTLTSKARR